MALPAHFAFVRGRVPGSSGARQVWPSPAVVSRCVAARVGTPRILWSILPVLVAVVLLRSVLSLRGYLYLDDFAFRYWAATSPFGTEYLLRSYGGHVNPVGLAVQWVMQVVFPGSYLALALYSLTMFALALGIFAAIVWEVTGSRGASILAVALAGVSLFGFEVTVWWAASIYAAAFQVFLLLTVYAAIRAVRDRKSLWTYVGVAGGAGMVLSFSRGSLGAVLVFGLAAALPLVQGRPLGLREAFMRARALWVALAAVAVLGGVLVLASADRVTPQGFSVGAMPGYAWRLLVLNVLPALWGGPWRWFELPPQEWPPILANPAPMWWAVWFAAILTMIALVAVIVKIPSLRLLVAVVFGYVFAVLVLAGVARAGALVGSVAYRYTFDLVWPLTLLMVLGVFPALNQARRVWRPGVVVMSLIVVSALMSTVVPARDWAANPGKEYMANAVSGFAQIPTGQTVIDQGVPFDLIDTGLMAPYANARTVMTPQPGAPEFGLVARDALWGWAEDGSVEEQKVVGPTSVPGPDPDCGYRVTDVPRSVPLDGKLIAWDFYARVAYFSGTDTTLNFAVGGRISSVALESGGLKAVYFPVNGPGQDVLVSVSTPGVSVCLTEIKIGNRESRRTGDVVPLPVTKLAR